MLVVTKHTILSCDVILAEFIFLYQHPKGVLALRLNQPCFSPRFRALAPFSALSAIHAVKQFCFNYFSAPPRETSTSFRFFLGFRFGCGSAALRLPVPA